MDYLQYLRGELLYVADSWSFKPYYKWITFNINGTGANSDDKIVSFKPYYKWITFNTDVMDWAQDNQIEF